MILFFKNALVSKDLLLNVITNIEYNKDIIKYYDILSTEIEDHKKQTIENKVINIKDCNNLWDLDFYKQSKIKDFKKTNLCKDKFCNNCKKVQQAAEWQSICQN